MFQKTEKAMIIIKPHNKKSRIAVDKDAQFIAEQASEMMLLAAKIEHDRKFFDQVFGIHHSQVSKKPLDFFVLNPTNDKIVNQYGDRESFIFINPVIVNHTRHTVDSIESCLSFAGMPGTTVQRWNKIELVYQVLVEQDDGTFLISEPHKENINGLLARICQHEIGHANAEYIYNL